MADEKTLESEIVIDGTTATWQMKLDGDVNGTYSGTFKFRCTMSPTQRIAAGREMRELLGPQALLATDNESNLAFALTQLKHRVLEAPPFWKTGGQYDGDILDSNIIMAVLDAAVTAEVKYIKSLKEKKLSAIERAKAAAERALSATTDDADEADEDELD